MITIAPSKRNLICYLALCALAVYLFLFYRSGTVLSGILLLGAAGMGILDIWISKPVLSGVSVDFPELVRMSKNRETPVLFSAACKHRSLTSLKIGLALPEVQFNTRQTRQVTLEKQKVSVEWPITGIRQGQYILRVCYIEIESVFGLWTLRKKQALHCEVRVYPDLFSQWKTLASRLPGKQTGSHVQKMMGKGREFERLREYLPGDLYEDIHWKATAKRGVPVTKTYQIEQTRDVYVIIDASRLSARESGRIPSGGISNESMLEQYINTGLCIGMAAEKQGDKFGLVVFSDQVRQFIPAGRRTSHFRACKDMLYTLQPHLVTPDFTELITFIGSRITKRSLLIFLTSLDDRAVAKNLVDHVHILSRRHLLVINMLKPSDAAPIFSSGSVAAEDEIYTRLGGHMVWTWLRELERSFHRMGIGFFLHPSGELTHQAISQYLTIKQRQAI